MLPVIDAHADTLSRIYENKMPPLIDFSRHCNNKAVFLALWGHSYDTLMTVYRDELDNHKKTMAHCKTLHDMQTAWHENKLATFLSIEGADVIDCDAARLDQVKKDGIRMIAPVWNKANKLCGSCRDLPAQGLTEQGREFIERCFELRFMIDLSHASDATFWDIAALAKSYNGRIVCSHSNARELCNTVRNISDEMFYALRDADGVIGLNLFTYFVNGTDAANWEDAAGHIMHWIKLGGENTIALGGDWDGCDLHGVDYMVGENRIGLDYTPLYAILKACGISIATIEKLFYRNMMRMI